MSSWDCQARVQSSYSTMPFSSSASFFSSFFFDCFVGGASFDELSASSHEKLK